MGTTITNNAEITAATNALGLIDEDHDLATIQGSSNDTTEIATNDEYSDEYSNAPGTSDLAADVDDYDPEQILIQQDFDLALKKILGETGPFVPGDTITFNIIVYNQGTIDGTNIVITDYPPTGMTNVDSDWTNNTFSVGNLAFGDSILIPVDLKVSNAFMGARLTNNAEITAATNALGLIDEDNDLSTIHGSIDHVGEVATDDNIDDEGIGTPGSTDNPTDVDDYDLAIVPIMQDFDLALDKKVVGASPFIPGDTVTFNITVYNQGTLDATDVVITEYPATGMTTIDPAWILNKITIDTLLSGQSTSITVQMKISDAFGQSSMINNAEITSATNALGAVDTDSPLANIDGSTDDDSEQDTDNDVDDDGNGTPGTIDNKDDVDDYDPAEIQVRLDPDLALRKIVDPAIVGASSYGDSIRFAIELYNQGTVGVDSIRVTDYLPVGFEFINSNTLNSGWDATDINNPVYNWSGQMLAGQSDTIYIYAKLIQASTFSSQSYTNYAEISYARDLGGRDISNLDIDSKLNNTSNDNGGGQQGSPADDTIDGDGSATSQDGVVATDQDNVDPAVLEIVDLALMKIVDPSLDQTALKYGDVVTFLITVQNQGNVVMDSVEIIDYMPQGYTFDVSLANNADWSTDGMMDISGVTQLNYVSKTRLVSGASVVVSLDLTLEDIDVGSNSKSWINYAEITEAYDTMATAVGSQDVDSTPGSNSDEENAILPDGSGDNDLTSTSLNGVGSEDDHDPAGVEIFDLALTKTLNMAPGIPIVDGDTVVYDIHVWNQGNVAATQIMIQDYLPCGLKFVSDIGDFDVTGHLTTTDTLQSGANVTYKAYLEILRGINLPSDCSGDRIYDNYVEIISAMDESGNPTDDIDSNTGSDSAEERAVVPGDTGDNDISSTSRDSIGSEDDHDGAAFVLFDIALKKTIVNVEKAYKYGDTIDYRITIYNQGNVPIENLMTLGVTDYLPDGLKFLPAINPSWTDIGGGMISWDTTSVGGFTNSNIMTGDSLDVFLKLELQQSFTQDAFLNAAEISKLIDVTGTQHFADNDSRFDNNPLNDPGGSPMTGSDNAINGSGTGGIGGDDPLTDEDDHDIAVVTIVDYALTKEVDTLSSPAPYAYGDTIKFDITVYNQGNVVADLIEITDYVPEGYNFDNTIAGNSDWSIGGLGIVRTLTNANLDMNQDTTVSIFLITQPSNDIHGWENIAEISHVEDPDEVTLDDRDVDSPLDDDSTNNFGNVPNTTDDNNVDGNGITTDQDNVDPALIEVFDLALAKKLITAGPFSYGDILMFRMTVYNQGNVDAHNIQLTEHIPDGYRIDPAYHGDNNVWTSSVADGPIDLIATVIPYLAAQQDTSIDIFLELIRSSNADTSSWLNYTEISDAEDVNGNKLSKGDLLDVDSKPNTDGTNENSITPGGPGDDDVSSTSNDGIGSEDDHDPAGVEIYDIALRKVLTSTDPVKFGDELTFDIWVFNQGNQAVKDVSIQEYINTGYTYNTSNNSTWILQSDGNASTTISSTILPGDSAMVSINLIVNEGVQAGDLLNYAEVSSMNNKTGGPAVDIDSKPDASNTNDGDINDDNVNNENTDEDDHDIAVPPVFDLALMKTIISDVDGLRLGSQIVYQFKIINQGNIDATSIEIADFTDSALEFNAGLNPDWKKVDVHLEYLGTLDIPAGQSASINITLIIREPVILNQSEIIGARNALGISMNDKDIDSTPDKDMDNDVGGLPGSEFDNMINGVGIKDEDDHDPAFLIICTDLQCKAPMNISMDGNCKPIVTPDQILKSVDYPLADYNITYFDNNGQPLSEPQFNLPMKVMITVNYCPEAICWTDVLLEDKVAPTLTCTSDTIFCYEMPNYIPPMSYDGCGEVTLKVLNETIQRVCGDSIIRKLTRTYTVVDEQGNEAAPCTQELYIKLFDIQDVIFPSDTTFACNNPIVADLDTFSGTAFGVPTFNGQPLSNFIGDTCKTALEYKDIIIRDEPCKRQILRTWTIYQWRCTVEKKREFGQLINIEDTAPPVVTVPMDTVKEFATLTDCMAEIDLPILSAIDNCDDVVEITLSGGFGIIRHDLGQKLVLPLGTHMIELQAFDDCHNIANDTFYVLVMDEAPPTVLCLEKAVVSLNGLGLVSIHANTFDAGSYDACGGDLKFKGARMDDVALFDSLEFEGIGDTLTAHGEWYIPLSLMNAGCNRRYSKSGTIDSIDYILRKDLFQKDVQFCCADVQKEVRILLQATDEIGRDNTCMTVISVDDKSSPQITCPPDITVICDLTISNFTQFGNVVFEGQQKALKVPENYIVSANGPLVDGVAFGNCLDNVSVENTTDINECGLGTIKRKFTVAGKNGREMSCVQTITIEDDGSVKPKNIVYPNDMRIDTCISKGELSNLDTGYPFVSGSKCDLIGFAFKDEIVSLSGEGGCFKILRSWRAYNRCDRNKSVIGTHGQIVEIIDNIAPEFVSCSTAALEFTLLNPCINGMVEVSKIASDNCTAPDQILWELNVDVNNDGSFDHKIVPKDTVINGQSVASAHIPIELLENRIQWIILDQCGGKNVCEEIINVKGSIQPEAICIRSLTADLSKSDDEIEEVVVWAKEFDLGSSTVGCSNIVDLEYSFDSLSLVISRTFTCADIDTQHFKVFLLAIEKATGNVLDNNFCNVELILTDHDDSCIPGTANVFINGNIENHKGGMLANADVILIDKVSGNSNTQSSGIYGTYVFEDVFIGRNYNVKPVKNDDWLNGVSTLDLIMIQNHILGKDKLKSGYELIAADINNDKTISAIDMVLLRKLILGIDTEVKSNKSWRFTWKGQNVGAMSLNDLIQEDYNIPSLREAINIDWNGIKVGDISGNASVNNMTTSETRSNDAIQLTYTIRNVNGHAIISFFLPAMEYIGMQGEIKIPEGIYISQFSLEQLDFKSQNIIIDKDKNIIRISHALTDKVIISADQPVFAVVVDGAIDENISINFSKKWMMPEIYNDLSARKLDMIKQNLEATSFRLFQNEPNPWIESSVISFYLPARGPVSINVIDMNGKMIWDRHEYFNAGKHTITLDKNDVPFQGVMIYEVQYADQILRKKMIHIK